MRAERFVKFHNVKRKINKKLTSTPFAKKGITCVEKWIKPISPFSKRQKGSRKLDEAMDV